MLHSVQGDQTLKQAVATQFASRPTVRQVLSQQVFDVVCRHYPAHAAAAIDHHQHEPYTLWRPDTTGTVQAEGCLTLLLKVFVQGGQVAFGSRDLLVLTPYAAGQTSVLETQDSALALAALNHDLEQALDTLLVRFQQAQVAFWNEDDVTGPQASGISRHGWMRQMLRLGLAGHLQRSALGPQERAVVYEVLLGQPHAPSVSAIELTRESDGETYTQLLPELLIEAERDERRLLLRCPPSGQFEELESEQALVQSLYTRFAVTHQIDGLAWRRRQLAEDVFFQQSAMLLESLLNDIDRLRLSAIDDNETLEQTLHWLSDPARHFLDDVLAALNATPEVPDWLVAATSRDRFEYQVAMLDVAFYQGACQGATSLDGVQPLSLYAAGRLREQLLKEWPVEANYFPDDLVLHVSVPDSTVDKELPARLKPAGSVSLTEFAINRLGGLQDAVVTSIGHLNDQLIMPWMTPAYCVRLVETVDIGGHYPGYVAALLRDPAQQAQRMRLFAREWRLGLLFDALRAKVDGVLDEHCWETLAEFCRSDRDLKATVDVAPLGFKADPSSQRRDEVTCMYVITLHQPSAVLLYRPLYPQQALLSYPDNRALMAAIAAPGALQQSVLDWLPESLFSTYANGGFLEPHLRRVIFDTSLWPEPVAPARLALSPYKADIDSRLYVDRCRALLELGDRQSLSNAEQRWEVVQRFGWLLFDLVAPIVPGLLGKIAGLASLFAPLLQAPVRLPLAGSDSVFSVELAANLALALLHGRLPEQGRPNAPVNAGVPVLAAPRSRAFIPLLPEPIGVVHQPALPLQEWEGHLALGDGWGTGPEARRRLLEPFRADVDLSKAARGNGLDEVNGRFYVSLAEGTFEVMHDDNERRIKGPDGAPGPLLVDAGGWRIRLDGVGLGGSPGGARRPRNQARFDSLATSTNRMVADINADIETGLRLMAEEQQARRQLTALQEARAKAQANEGGLSPEQVERLLTLYEGKVSKQREEANRVTLRYVEHLEAVVEKNVRIVEQVDEMIDLQRHRTIVNRIPMDAFQASRKVGCETIVRYCWALLPRLFDAVDYPQLRRMAQALKGKPVGPFDAQYQAYRTRLVEVVRLQPRVVKASALLDRFMPQVAADVVIIVDHRDGAIQTLEQVKAQRNVTTVEMRFQQAVYCSDLALRPDQPDPAGNFMRYQRGLMNRHLMAAAFAHGEAQLGNLSVEDRIEVLQSAWDEYSAALINAIDVRADSGTLVDISYLTLYQEALQGLKNDVSDRLVEAQGVLDGDEPPGPGAYLPSPETHGIARAEDGQILVGTEVEHEGRMLLEIRDPLSRQVVKQYQRQGQDWVELTEVAAGSPSVPALDKPALIAEAWLQLGQDVAVRNQAQEYVAQQVNHRLLTRLVDEHIARLQAVAQPLAQDDGATARSLRKRLEAWPDLRRSLLVELFSQTRFPDAQGLRFLHEEGLIKVEYLSPRRVLADGSALDEYVIRLLARPGAVNGKPIWVAHFHFAAQGDPATAFTRGHLKAWAQRKYGARDARLLADQGERIHRGPLTLAQAQGIIPFQ